MSHIEIKGLFPELQQSVRLLVQHSDDINEMLKDQNFELEYSGVSKLFEVNLPQRQTFMEENTTLWESRKNTLLLKPVINSPESNLVKSLESVFDDVKNVLSELYEDLYLELTDDNLFIRKELFTFSYVLSQAVEGKETWIIDKARQSLVPSVENGQYVLEEVPSLEVIETALSDISYEKILLSSSVGSANRVLLALTALIGHSLKVLPQETPIFI